MALTKGPSSSTSSTRTPTLLRVAGAGLVRGSRNNPALPREKHRKEVTVADQVVADLERSTKVLRLQAPVDETGSPAAAEADPGTDPRTYSVADCERRGCPPTPHRRVLRWTQHQHITHVLLSLQAILVVAMLLGGLALAFTEQTPHRQVPERPVVTPLEQDSGKEAMNRRRGPDPESTVPQRAPCDRQPALERPPGGVRHVPALEGTAG